MVKISPCSKIAGRLTVPGDKSISHRLLMFAAFADGASTLLNLSPGDDVKKTILALKNLGVRIQGDNGRLTIEGLQGVLSKPTMSLDCGNSGTTARFLMGVLSSQRFSSVISGDASLHRRPMGRVANPLREMGAKIYGPQNGEFLPMTVEGGPLHGKVHRFEMGSAQVKTAVLIAGLKAEGETRIVETLKSRDHSERLLKHMGASIEKNGDGVVIRPGKLHAIEYKIPADFSSAALFITLALLHSAAAVEIHSVNLNQTRTGLLEVFKRMGGRVEIDVDCHEPEPVGTIRAWSSDLKAVELDPAMLPTVIDELPLLALAATQAHGTTRVTGANELRKKESDRIRSVVVTIRALGAHIEELADGFEIEGPCALRGGVLDGFDDHRIVMMQAIAGVLSQSGVVIKDEQWVRISYPSFLSDLSTISTS